jgi:hypothetical protein
VWREKQYERAIEFYAIERSIWKIRGKRASRSSTRIAKPSRQLHRSIGRKFAKLSSQLDKRKR